MDIDFTPLQRAHLQLLEPHIVFLTKASKELEIIGSAVKVGLSDRHGNVYEFVGSPLVWREGIHPVPNEFLGKWVLLESFGESGVCFY